MPKKIYKTLELPKEVNFATLVGETASLYAGKNNLYQFQLGQVVFEVVEDENDGYRSSMRTVKIVKEEQTITPPLANVTIRSSDSNSETIYELVDNKDGHIWLQFGTDNRDDYYPRFIYTWQPKEPESLKRLKQLIK